jgi:hypothetical protein
MRTLLIALTLTLAFAPAAFATQVQDLARLLINQPNGINEYSGLTAKGISCGAWLQLREGRLEAGATWGDSGAGVKADLRDTVKVISKTPTETVVQIYQFDEPTSTATLAISNGKITSMKFVADDQFLFIPVKSRLDCGQLEQFVPKKL